MKRKLVTILAMLTLGLGYCKPPVEDCVGFPQNPAVCRGFVPPPVRAAAGSGWEIISYRPTLLDFAQKINRLCKRTFT